MAPGRINMRKAMVFLTLVLSGIALSFVFGFMLVMRRVSLYQMNHMKALHQ
jgi:cytochrome b subunit of formate dehydrogenase